MFDKLKLVEMRFEEVGQLLSDPSVISDNEQFKKLMKEHKELTPIVEKYREYAAAKTAEAEANELLEAGGLDKDFKLNIEANHATLAGHTFQHELRISEINGMLGSIDANQGDLLLGWDTDEFPSDVYDATFCMYEVLKAGGLTGGFNFDAKNRRASYTYEDMFYAFILAMDTYALGLINAAKIIEDGRIDKFIKEKYESFESEIGKRILGGEAKLEELSDYALKLKKADLPISGKQECLQSIINSILFS